MIDVDALEKLTMIKKEKVLKALSFFKERLGLQFISLKAGIVFLFFSTFVR